MSTLATAYFDSEEDDEDFVPEPDQVGDKDDATATPKLASVRVADIWS